MSTQPSYNSAGTLSGARTYQRVLFPETTGFVDIPLVEYAYFDPTQERYLTISTEPIAVTVSLDSTTSANDFPNAPSKLEVSRLDSDIRHIKTSPSSLNLKSEPLTSRQLFWALWALPAVLLVASTAWRFRERLQPGHSAIDPATLARNSALNTLHEARHSDSDHFAASGDALIGYLSARLDRPTSSLAHDRVSSLLGQADISSGLTQEVDALLNLTQDGRYGPAQLGDSVEPILDRTERLIDELEWEFDQ